MGERRRSTTRSRGEAPIPLDPVDLLAGLAPGVELQADDVPSRLADRSGRVPPAPALTTVAETGKLLRTGDATVRQLIRSAAIEPALGRRRRRRGERERAGVVPRSRARPGE